jgi:hypothetical protein
MFHEAVVSGSGCVPRPVTAAPVCVHPFASTVLRYPHPPLADAQMRSICCALGKQHEVA